MQFLVLIYADETKAMPVGPDLARLVEEYGELVRELAGSGRLRAGARLAPSAAAKTVRGRDGSPRVSEGPVAPSREQLAGCFLLECADLDEALRIAARVPGVRLGEAVEVRPVVA